MHVFFKRHNAYDVRLKIFHCNYDVKLNSLHWYQIVCSAMSSFFVVEYGYVMVMGYLLNVVYDYFLCAHDSSEFAILNGMMCGEDKTRCLRCGMCVHWCAIQWTSDEVSSQ